MQNQGRSDMSIRSRAILSALFLAACRSSGPSANALAPVSYPTIVRLESRNYSIEISAGPHAPVYSIKAASGQMLCENLSLAQLHQSHPQLFNLLAPALAPDATANATTADIFSDDR
jgi:hypothetical protein